VYKKEVKTIRKIQKFNFRDIQALNGLRLCGYALRSDLESIITGNRIDTYLLQGYLERKVTVEGQEVLTYTTKGKTMMKQLDSLQGKAFYPKQSNAITHDTTLFRQYAHLSPAERMSALSETETRNHYRERLDEGNREESRHSMPDLVYVSEEGETVAIEVTTSNYSSEKIEMKMSTASRIGAEIRFIKT